MTEKVFQLVPAKSKKDELSAEFLKALDEMYGEIRSGKPDFIIIVAEPTDPEMSGVSFMTNLNQPSANLLLDQVKLTLIGGA